MTLAERISLALEVRGKTYTDLASEVGVTRSAVGHWANDRRQPDVDDLRALAKALDVDVAWLAFEQGDAPVAAPIAAPIIPDDDRPTLTPDPSTPDARAA